MPVAATRAGALGAAARPAPQFAGIVVWRIAARKRSSKSH